VVDVRKIGVLDGEVEAGSQSVFEDLGVQFVQLEFGLFNETLREVSLAEQHGVFNKTQVFREVELLVQDLEKFVGAGEVGAVDPVREAAVSERVDCGPDVDWFDAIADRMVALLLDEVDWLARHENLEGQVETDEERDEVHEDLLHFIPRLLFDAVVVFGDEELSGGFIEAAFIHPGLDAVQNGLVDFEQEGGANLFDVEVPVLLHALDQGGQRLLLLGVVDVLVDLVDHFEPFDGFVALQLQVLDVEVFGGLQNADEAVLLRYFFLECAGVTLQGQEGLLVQTQLPHLQSLQEVRNFFK